MAQRGPAPEGTYRHALRKIAEHDPDYEELVCGVDESVQSRDVTHPDGLRRRTVYITSDTLRDRLLKMGWEDVPSVSAIASAPEVPAPPPVVAPPPGRLDPRARKTAAAGAR